MLQDYLFNNEAKDFLKQLNLRLLLKLSTDFHSQISFGRPIPQCRSNDRKGKITEFEMVDTKDSSTAYVVMYKLIT